MAITAPISPLGTVSLAATVASGRVALTANAAQVIVTCPAGNADIAFVHFGGSVVTATTATGVPCLPGSVQTFSIGSATYGSAICPTSTATVYFTIGFGG